MKYPGLRNFIIDQLGEGIDISHIYQEAVNNYGYDKDIKKFRNYVSDVKYDIKRGRRSLKDDYAYVDKDEIIPDKYEPVFVAKKNIEINQGITDADVEEVSQEFRGNFLKLIRKAKNISIIDAANTLECPPKNITEAINYYIGIGYEIGILNDNIIFDRKTHVPTNNIKQPLSDYKDITFAVSSDLHFGSTACQITAMNEFNDICDKEGVKHILVAGDIFAGYNTYRGQEYDVYAKGSDKQIESAVINLPNTNNKKYYMLGGNHDYTYIKSAGVNVVKALSILRHDVEYLNFDIADIPLLTGVDARLWHPSGGSPYSTSYRAQKGGEQLNIEELTKIAEGTKEKPTINFFFVGHLHVQMQMLMGNMLAMQVGCFEGTTNYLKRKALVPAIGGYIIKASINKNGFLRNYDCKFHRFQEIENDFENYNHSLPNNSEILKPVLGKW